VSRLSLHDLIHALAGAVVEAQDKIQRFQITMVRRYFDEFDRPVGVDVRLPSMSLTPTEDDAERIVHVPLLSLSSPQLLGIKEVDIEFEVGLGTPDTPSPSATRNTVAAGDDDTSDAGSDELHKALGVDMGASRNRGTGGMARVTLKVERQEPSDGMARLIQHLDKLI
jgi:hypothetical protein